MFGKAKADDFLVGGFNPLEKYESNWESSPSRGENKKCLKPPPSFGCFFGFVRLGGDGSPLTFL